VFTPIANLHKSKVLIRHQTNLFEIG